jgi:formate transporter
MPDGRERQYMIDARLPPEMAIEAEEAGAAKAGRDTLSLLVLSILAGAFIAFGALFMTVVVSGNDGSLPYGVARLLGGLVFSLGLILVVVGGAELFTGDNLMVMAWAGRVIKTRTLLRVWAIVYIGNLIGAVGTAGLVFMSGQGRLAGGVVGKTALGIAAGKAEYPFLEAIVLGVLANVLVCLAIWLSYSARTVVGKVFAIVPPISAFVAAGFEHSIANMYFFPIALMIKAWEGEPFWRAIGASPKDYPGLTLMAALGNIAPVTIGNIIGGGVLVGAVYWFVYLRNR